MILLPCKTHTSAASLRKTRHDIPGQQFLCADCGIAKPLGGSGCGTGYGYKSRSNRAKPICYACCGENDRKEMAKTGKAFLYLSKAEGKSPWKVSNWPGTLAFPVYYVQESFHNFAGRNGRRDCWFTGPDGARWHAVNIGDNQVARCKRLSR